MNKLAIKIGNLTFNSPVIAASGTFGFGLEYKEILNLNDFGAIITKGITTKRREGNPLPRIIETPCGLINSIGLANPGVEEFIKQYGDIYKIFPTNVIVNVAGDNANDFINIIKRIEHLNVIGYELNLSCPNVSDGGMILSEDPNDVYILIKTIRNITNKLIISKLTPNLCNTTELARASEEAGCDAISLVNTYLGMSIDIETGYSRIGKDYGGYSGPAIKPMALKLVYDVSNTVDIPIIGIGGISSGSDAIEFLIAGASLIQVGSIIFRNPQIAFEINTFIENYMDRKSINNLNDIIGTFKGSI
ncbi:dihydroorotate dehydrogenase [candidate division WOR-3 bacterium]|jgi:dihydroorotate dehydrogenase (NAD+) catalytic subunit|nr:dihydroorotate dehydrogenase [candidate division WOR-3 bacterium]